MKEIRKETCCSCDICKDMCKSPCLGTPSDIGKLLDNGYGDRLSKTVWGFGMLVGTHEKPVMMVQPTLNEETGYCTFYKDGLCELHDLGLKPTEGKLAHHSDKKVHSLKELKETPLYDIVREWEKLNLPL